MIPITASKYQHLEELKQVLPNTLNEAGKLSLQEELEEAITACKDPRKAKISLDQLLKKEMNLYESGGSKGELLQFAYNFLTTIVPTSVESERAQRLAI
ncbi:unnamed protein product [Colias eurytheme]|nr:unnamed protein product [Colias eurytheme]